MCRDILQSSGTGWTMGEGSALRWELFFIIITIAGRSNEREQ